MADTIFNVDATALFYTAPNPNQAALLDRLNAAFEGTPGCYLTKSPLSHGTWWLLSCKQFHLMIGFENMPAPMARFTHAVTSPITRLNRFEYDHAAQNHNLHVTIEIGDGNAPLPPEARRIMQEFGQSSLCDPAIKMKALHVASQFIAESPGFLALHFAPSDRLLSAEDLKAARGQDVPVDLLLHPVPTEVDRDAYGRETWALRLKNPHHLPGPAIEIEGIPRAVPLGTAVNLLRTLNRAYGSGKLNLEDGETISPTGKWALHVFRIAPDLATPNGRIVLSFYKDRVAYAPLVTDPALETVETEPQGSESGFAAKALASLRNGDVTPKDVPPMADPAPASLSPATKALPRELQPVEMNAADTAEPAQKRAAPEPQTAPMQPVAATAAAPASQVAETAPHAWPETDRYTDNGRVSLLGWMVERCKSLPKDARATAAGVAVVLALTSFANPYDGFTGGHDTKPGNQRGIATKVLSQQTFASLMR